MSLFEKSLESKVKIRFSDCDPFGHLNNSRYIDYIMNARTDQLLEHYGLDVHHLAVEQGIGWVAAQTQLSFLRPAYPNETVTIETRLLAASDKSLLLEGVMWNEKMTKMKTLLWAKLVHFHLKLKRSHVHDSPLMELFAKVVNPLEKPMGFEERSNELRNQLKLTI